jgi:RNA polymerase sigma factor
VITGLDAGWDFENNRIAIAQIDTEARESYLADHRTFIHKVASSFAQRPLSWNTDDELSIALIAFNEAIDAFNPEKGVPFLGFVRTVIYNRLTDYLRKETRHRHLSLVPAQDEESSKISKYELDAAWENYYQQLVRQERAEELARYQGLLGSFGLTMQDLVSVSPKHRDTRENLMRAAIVLCSNLKMQQALFKNKQLPMKELSLASGIHLKTLERGRKYIIAVACIVCNEDLIHLRSYVKFPEEQGGS